MNTVRVIAISGIVIMLASGFVSLAGADPYEPMADGSTEFDRQRCEMECRSRFGYELYFSPGGGTGAYWAYASCMADCDRKFWKQFDEDSKKLQQ